MGKTSEFGTPGRWNWAVLGGAGLWLVLAGIFGLAGASFGRFPGLPEGFTAVPAPSAALGHAFRIGGAVLLSLILLGTGRRLLGPAGVRPRSGWEEACLSFGLGYGAWGTVVLLLGLCRLFYPALLLGLAIAGTVLAARPVLEMVGRVRSRARSGGLPAWGWVAAALFAFAFLARLAFVMIPETFYDAQEYHLGLPNLYLLRHRICPAPENSFSGVPSLPIMIYALTLSADRWGILAQMTHYAHFLWVGAGIMAAAHRVRRPECGPLACAVFALTPVVASESFRTSVGLEWALFQLLCFIAFIAAAGAEAGTRERRGWLVLCGVFLGFSMATKYPAWLLPLSLGLGALVLRLGGATVEGRPGAGFGARECGIVLAVALALVSPWIAKNIAYYGNPIYPFMHESISPGSFHTPDWTYLSSGGLSLRESLMTSAGIKRFLLHPFSFTRARDMGSGIGPLYLGLLPLLLLVRLPRDVRLLGWLCLGAWLPLSLYSPIPRYFIPSLTALCVVLAAAVTGLQSPRARGLFAALTCACCAAAGVAYTAMDIERWSVLPVLLGRQTRWEYLSHTSRAARYPTPPHNGFQYLHSRLGPGDRALILGDARHFPLWRDHIASSADQASLAELWADRSGSADEVAARLRERGITHVLVNHAELRRNRPALRLSDEGKALFSRFWRRHTLKVHEDGRDGDFWVAVYRLLSEEEAASPHPSDDLLELHSVAPSG